MSEYQHRGVERAEELLGLLAGPSRTPGLQYIVVSPSEIVFARHQGLADISRHTLVDATTTMMAYSMSKTFTAVAALQLVEAAKVGLDDPVARYVDDWPYGPRVTVRHLISHTSGIPNPIPLRWVHPAARHDHFDEPTALAAVLKSHPRLSFEPGNRYAYSNIGYWMLGTVIERASGEPFPKDIATHVLRPLGISDQELGYQIVDPVHHATGYLERYSLMNLVKGFLIDRELIGGYSGSWLEIRSHYLNGPAFGGLVGTARSVATFLQDQLRERSVLLGGPTRQLLYTPQRTSGGNPIAMTLGWHIGDLNGTRFYFKEGGGGGFHCMMRVYPQVGLGTVVMSNATAFDVRRFLDATDRSFMETSGS